MIGKDMDKSNVPRFFMDHGVVRGVLLFVLHCLRERSCVGVSVDVCACMSLIMSLRHSETPSLRYLLHDCSP